MDSCRVGVTLSSLANRSDCLQLPAVHTTEQLNSALTGRYAIERLIGEGGMATVYLARDVRHNRKVALKVLKPDLGAIVGVERFLSEIEVTANLQHPNLLPLFDSGAADGLLFYVMPYVEGESLRARLEREKQLPVEESVRIAAAVASALDYAHRRGVIHRDLKPENILLHDGQPLVADFGIALAVSNAGGDRVTQTGLSLGTPRYMSPEQATGDRAIDARTDIYSLGAVTYEMLTGDPPHTGSSSQAIIARVLTERPRSIRSSRPNVPLHVEATVDRALEKLAADRFESAKEFADALTGKVAIATTASTVATMAGASTVSRRRERALAAALGVAVLGLVALAIALARPRTDIEAPVISFEFDTPASGAPLQVSVSPDGQAIAFGVGGGGGTSGSIWTRRIGSTNLTPVSGTDGSLTAYWSPDSKEIAFFVGDRLKRVPASGGTPTTIVSNLGRRSGAGLSWSSQNVILYSSESQLYRVPAAGGTPSIVPLNVAGATRWEHPVFLPDGRHFLVVERGADERVRGTYLGSLDGDQPVRVHAGALRVGFAPPDQLLFVEDDALYAQTLDVNANRLVGEPIPVAEDVSVNTTNGVTGFSVAPSGTLAYRAIGVRGYRQLRWFSRNGTPGEPVGDSAIIREIALSPDERRVAFTGAAPRTTTDDAWVFDLGSGVLSRLTSDSVGVSGVLWSQDGLSLTYRQAFPGRLMKKTIGSARDSVIDSSATVTRAEDYAFDNATLLIRRVDTLVAVSTNGANAPRVLGAIPRIDQVRFSPDGKHLAYGSNESGIWQVHVANYPGLDQRRQVSANGGRQPRWRGDGRELYFLSPEGKVMAAALRPGNTSEFTAPAELFHSPWSSPSAVADEYDVTRDGQRFLMMTGGLRQETSVPMTVVLNWKSGVKKN
jgi:serine/threonine-protein kinase